MTENKTKCEREDAGLSRSAPPLSERSHIAPNFERRRERKLRPILGCVLGTKNHHLLVEDAGRMKEDDPYRF